LLFALAAFPWERQSLNRHSSRRTAVHSSSGHGFSRAKTAARTQGF